MLPVGVDSFALGQQPVRLKTQVGYLTRDPLLLNNCSFEKADKNKKNQLFWNSTKKRASRASVLRADET